MVDIEKQYDFIQKLA